MTTQQQTDQPLDLGQRVARLEGRFDELSPRIDQLQRSVDNLGTELRAEMQAMGASLREDASNFKNMMFALVVGTWLTVMVAIIATRFIE